MRAECLDGGNVKKKIAKYLRIELWRFRMGHLAISKWTIWMQLKSPVLREASFVQKSYASSRIEFWARLELDGFKFPTFCASSSDAISSNSQHFVNEANALQRYSLIISGVLIIPIVLLNIYS